MKRVRVLLLFLLCITLLLWGCASKENELSDSIRIKGEIQKLINTQLNAIKEGDINKFVNTLDNSNFQYLAERKSWFRDILDNNIEDLSIEVLDVEKIDQREVLAKVKQTYTFKDNKYVIDFQNKYIKVNNKWVDGDLNFKIIETEHFIIKYLEDCEENGRLAAIGADEAYNEIVKKIGIEPEDKTVIKIYSNKELLRQSVKLSFAWQFSGWYEYPESIKTITYDSKDIYKEIVEHELTHKLTISKSNNNLPYWFSEGLAMYFTEFYDLDLEELDRKELSWVLSISELENMNLETMTNKTQIANYYDSSGIIVRYISQKFGRDKVLEIVDALGEYEYVEGTGIEVNPIAIERFHSVVPKVLGITVKELDKELKN